MARLNNFWQNKKVFITGHTGFKGAWLSLWLTSLGATVTGYSIDIPTNPSLFKLLNLPIKTIWGDINDSKKIAKTIKKYQPEIIFHLAAQPLVRTSYKEPIETFTTNVLGTANVLEAIRQCPTVKAAVMITTDKVYLNQEKNRAFIETDPLGGHDPYSASKAAAEIVISSYRNSFFYQNRAPMIASARAGNVIGGGDFALDRLIPDCLRSITHGEKILIRNPRAIRPWQYVLEPLAGYLLLGQKLLEGKSEFADAWNFGPKEKDAKTVEWIVKKSCREFEAQYIIDNGQHPHEVHYLKLNAKKAMRKLKWQPIWDINQALDKIIEWQKEYNKNPKFIKNICMQQIQEYQEAVK